LVNPRKQKRKIKENQNSPLKMRDKNSYQLNCEQGTRLNDERQSALFLSAGY
jgi:hypothetical protein